MFITTKHSDYLVEISVSLSVKVEIQKSIFTQEVPKSLKGLRVMNSDIAWYLADLEKQNSYGLGGVKSLRT